MNCQPCSRRILSLFSRPFVNVKVITSPAIGCGQAVLSTRVFSYTSRPQSQPGHAESPKPFASNSLSRIDPKEDTMKERPPWQLQKEALKDKLGGSAWNPRKKLSPDAMEGIRHLHKMQPERFTTPVLAQHFKVSPEAIRRILKSKWRPSDADQQERLRRWDRRGEKIWSNLVELGVKPPKKWREMGVGKAQRGGKPKWKSRAGNQVPIHDSVSDEEILPIVDGTTPTRPGHWDNNIPLSERIAV